jgi:hypothetical protein
MGVRLTRVCALVAMLAMAAPALAQGESALATARKDIEGSDYMGARGALQAALAAGTASPEELTEIYKLSGIVEGALGNDKDAAENFRKWLSIDPKGTLPAGTSPKITRPFDSAAARVKSRGPLKVKVETTASPPTVTLVVVNDPEALVEKARVFVRADGKAETTVDGDDRDKGGIKIALPQGDRLDLRVQALDEHGNRVVELGSKDVPIVITHAKPDIPKKDDKKTPPTIVHHEPGVQRPLYLRWWMWTGAAVAFAGAGTYFGWQAHTDTDALSTLNAESQSHMFTEASDLAKRAKREALFFNIGWSAAGVFAIGATILYATRPDLETRVAVVPQQGGAAVVYGGAF